MELLLADDSLPLALAVAFFFGLAAKMAGFPPMVGFLLAGFGLSQLGVEPTEAGRAMAELGVILLLFLIGLKLKPKTMADATILGGAAIQMAVTQVVITGLLLGLAATGIGAFAGLGLGQAALLALALSFSSTVFAVKVFEEKGELGSIHGRVALGILIVQDVIAVVVLAASTGQLPSVWALGLVGLLALRPVLGFFLDRLDHGEMLTLFGLFAVLVLGVASFKLVGMKADLGALVLGMLMADHRRAGELVDSLMGFKDIFLIGFFLNIGLAGLPGVDELLAAGLLVLLLPVKAVLFFAILTGFRLRARTALLGALGLACYSEFGLIIGAVALDAGWIPAEWLTVLAMAMSLSFVVLAPLNARGHDIYARFHRILRRFERRSIAPDDRSARVAGAQIAIFGMGRLGAALYRSLVETYGEVVIGIETDPDKVRMLTERGWNVIHGDATDSDFWRRQGRPAASLRAVLLAMPEHSANVLALEQIRAQSYDGLVAALSRYPDELPMYEKAGADLAFDVYGEAGQGFAADLTPRLSALGIVPAGASEEAIRA